MKTKERQQKGMKDSRKEFLQERLESILPDVFHNMKMSKYYLNQSKKETDNNPSTYAVVETIDYHMLRHAESHAEAILQDIKALREAYKSNY